MILDTGATSFTVNAYLLADNKNPITDTYALSVALAPKTGPVGANLGSFEIDGTTVNVTADMVYGTPPLETIVTQLSDPGDLASHSIFDTYFYEVSFQFDGSQTASVNTEDTPGYDPTANPGTDLYYAQFVVDATLLDQTNPLALHFDLYNTVLIESCKGGNCTVGDVDQSQFAPFSHDAEWRPGEDFPPGPGPGVPVPAPLALIGIGGLMLGWMTRKSRA